MLRPTEMQHLNRPEISAFFPAYRGYPLAMLARLLAAYNPMIKPIGQYTFITDVANLALDIKRLREYVIDPEYHNIRQLASAAEAKEGAKLARELKSWEVVTEALAAGLYPTADRVYYRDALFGASKQRLRDVTESWMHTGLEFVDPAKGYRRILDLNTSGPDKAEQAFMASMLCYDWEPVRTSGFLVNVPDAGEGVQKGAYHRTMRALRIMGLKVSYAIAWRSMALRPYKLLLTDPNIKSRLILEYGPNAVEYIAVLEEMASLPTHRWLAIADSICLPGRNLTPWGATTVTYGLEAQLCKRLLGAATGRVPPEGEAVDPIRALPWAEVFTYARDMKQELRLLKEDEGLAIDSAMAALRFTGAGQRPRIGLMGKERAPLHTDGVSTNEAVAPLDLLFRDVMPCRTYGEPMPWVGEPTLLTLQTLKGAREGKLWLEEETLPSLGTHVLGRVSPKQLAFADEWQGEDDAVFAPANIPGVAQIFGLSADEMKAKIGTDPDSTGWGAFFAPDTDGPKARSGGATLYISSRTRRLAQIEVVVPRHPMEMIHAMQYGFVVKSEALQAQFVRDFEVPVASYDVADKLRAFAVDLLLKR